MIHSIVANSFCNYCSVATMQNILAWAVAGSLAYYFYVKPEQERAEEQRVRLINAH